MSKTARLAIALLCIELIGGMQIYLLQVIIPQVGADLDAKSYFGVLTTIGAAAMFFTMPLGPYALRRWKTSTILMVGTVVTMVGGVLTAIAPEVWTFAAGRIIGGLASGILASVSMAAIVTHLDRKWRQLVLAGISGMWVISSLVGPSYAALVTELWGWRVAMVLYLPALFLARVLVARNLDDQEQDISGEENLSRLLWLSAALFLGITAISVAPGLPAGSTAVLVAGMVVSLMVAARLLPAGVFRAAPGRPAALATLMLMGGLFMGADSIISIAAVEILGTSTRALALIVMASGFTWVILGLWTGARPATGSQFHRRVLVGGLLFVVGFGGIALFLSMASWPGAWWAVAVASGISGYGMGMMYLDTMNAVFEAPAGGDGISDSEAATATVLGETVSTSISTALCGAVVSMLVVTGNAGAISWVYMVIAVMSVGLVITIPRLPK